MGEMGNMGSTESKGMMRETRVHLRSMAGAGADSLRGLMPRHRQMTANMLQQMDSEMRGMRGMQVAGDTGWTALADSVRQELAQLPGVSTAELPEFMERHRGRVERLMARHERMPGSTR
jgi:hypothetical protein